MEVQESASGGAQEKFEAMGVFCILIMVVVTQVHRLSKVIEIYTSINTCKFYLNKSIFKGRILDDLYILQK